MYILNVFLNSNQCTQVLQNVLYYTFNYFMNYTFSDTEIQRYRDSALGGDQGSDRENTKKTRATQDV